MIGFMKLAAQLSKHWTQLPLACVTIPTHSGMSDLLGSTVYFPCDFVFDPFMIVFICAQRLFATMHILSVLA